MKSKKLFIQSAERFPKYDETDVIIFKKGVNVITGAPNAGKTLWLQMIDFMFGDCDPIEDVFDKDIIDKYDSIILKIEIDQEAYTMERRWKEKGNKSKIFINDKPVSCSDFSDYFLSLLDFPLLHFPSGNPYSSRAWPSLSWRELYRHIYRRQKSWDDIAAKQPINTQLACLLYFLGLADVLYSDDYSKLVALNKLIGSLESSETQLMNLINRIARDLIDQDSIGLQVTDQAIDARIAEYTKLIENLAQRSDEILQETIDGGQGFDDSARFKQVSAQASNLQDELEGIGRSITDTANKLAELQVYYESLTSELERFARTKTAGNILSDLKVTHCPACDQAVKFVSSLNHCFLCKQPTVDASTQAEGLKRIDFEIAQLNTEKAEAEELIGFTKEELETLSEKQGETVETLNRIMQLIQPLRSDISKIIPPDVYINRTQIGNLQEKIASLQRIKESLQIKDEIRDNLGEKLIERNKVESSLEQAINSIDFEQASAELSNYLNFYLNGEIKKMNNSSWTQGTIFAVVKERSFSINTESKSWKRLGGTMLLYFLAAYNYALLRLSEIDEMHYPGLSIIDMPAKFGDTQIAGDPAETQVVEPFTRIKTQTGSNNYQVIVAGSKFPGLSGANRIHLPTVWK